MFIVGALIVILPIVIWLALNNSLGSFWAEYIQFNLLYTETRSNTLDRLSLFVQFLYDPILIITLLSLLLFIWKISPLRIFWGLYLFCLLFMIFCSALGGSLHWHYCMTLVPMIALPFAQLWEYFHQKFASSVLVKIAVTLVCCIFILPVWGLSFGRLVKRAIVKDPTATSPLAVEIDKVIQAHTSHSDSISVYGNNDLFYIYSDRPHATKYSYQFPIGGVNPAILDDYFQQLYQELPKVVVVSGELLDIRMEQFLTDNHYTLEWAQVQDSPPDGYTVYIK